MTTEDEPEKMRITSETNVARLREYIQRRAENPILRSDRLTIWSFTSHEPDWHALEEKIPDLKADRYIIPYQVPGAWGYMQSLLPDTLREADLLVYSIAEHRYKAFTNFARIADEETDVEIRSEIADWLEEEGLAGGDTRDE